MTSVFTGFSAALLPYLLVAFLMVGANGYFIVRLFPRSGRTPNLATIILIFGLLVMSTGLWLSFLYAILSPGDTSTVAVFLAANSMMAVFGAWMIGVMLHAEEKHASPNGWLWPLLFASLIVGNDLLMGTAFVLLGSGGAPAIDAGVVGVLSNAVVSVWFFWAMLANMLVLVFWLPLPRVERLLLIGFAASTLAAPWIVAAPVPAAVVMTAIMAATFAVVAREVGRTAVSSRRFLRIVQAVAGGFAAMSFAALITVADPLPSGAPVVFATASLAVMWVELFVLARWAFRGFPGPRTQPDQGEPVPQVGAAPGRSDS